MGPLTRESRSWERNSPRARLTGVCENAYGPRRAGRGTPGPGSRSRRLASILSGFWTGGDRCYSTVAEPPAAMILSLALAENACTVTCSVTPASPVPSTLTGSPLRTAPLATRSSTVTSPPSG